MGEVYRASDTVLGRTVAVKLLADRHAKDPDVRARFTREARAAARLSGEPHVVTVFDVGERDGRPFIVMEYLDGGSVHDRLRAGRVPPGQALEWLSQAGQALDAAHEHGVVHRDVKPANLLLDGNGAVRVSDFGIALAAGFDTLTQPGTVLGTVGYLAPEQARGEPATAATDRYALGVVAFELLTGRRPFAADTPVTEALAHVNAEIPSAESIAADLPAGIDAVLRRALAKDPGGRPRSCAELVRELRAAFDEAEPGTVAAVGAVTAATQVARARVRRYSTRRRNAAYGAAAAALAVGGIVGAILLGAGGGGSGRTVTHVKTVVSTTSETSTTRATDGAALNEAGYRRMQAGDYAGALPLLERAVDTLAGSGSLAEAYASYNLAFTRFALGRCNGVLPLLDRSQQIQGHRAEIDTLRRRVERACEASPGRGKGKGKGRGKGDGND